MDRGKRLAGTPQRRFGYSPKRLYKPGKRLLDEPRPKGSLRRAALTLALCALTLFAAVDLTTAFLHDEDRIRNTFALGKVTPSVVETFERENRVKRDVSIRNDGDTPVYIRALTVITWKDAQGRTILSPSPAPGADYDLTGPAAESGWTLGGDGYYYYTKPVGPGTSTAKLIQTLKDKNTDATRQLSVDIIAQAVQASPTQAVTEVFPGVSLRDGTLVPPSRSEGGSEP